MLLVRLVVGACKTAGDEGVLVNVVAADRETRPAAAVTIPGGGEGRMDGSCQRRRGPTYDEKNASRIRCDRKL